MVAARGPAAERLVPEATGLCALPATELRSLIGRRAVSCREVLEAHIARIEAVNPALNAIVTKTYERARRQADELDANRSAHGALAGDRKSVV